MFVGRSQFCLYLECICLGRWYIVHEAFIPYEHSKILGTNINVVNQQESGIIACMSCGLGKASQIIAWVPPIASVFKFKVDGAARSKLGPTSIRVLRNNRGGVLLTFS